MTLKLSDFWHRFQGELFPALAEEVGPLLGTHRCFVAALDLVGVEGLVGAPAGIRESSPPDPQRHPERRLPLRSALPT